MLLSRSKVLEKAFGFGAVMFLADDLGSRCCFASGNGDLALGASGVEDSWGLAAVMMEGVLVEDGLMEYGSVGIVAQVFGLLVAVYSAENEDIEGRREG